MATYITNKWAHITGASLGAERTDLKLGASGFYPVKLSSKNQNLSVKEYYELDQDRLYVFCNFHLAGWL